MRPAGPYRSSEGYFGESLYNTNLAKLQLQKLLADVRARMARDAFWDAFRRRQKQLAVQMGLQREMLPNVPSWGVVLGSTLLGSLPSAAANYWGSQQIMQARNQYQDLLRALNSGPLEFGAPPEFNPYDRTLYGMRLPSPFSYGTPQYGWGHGYSPFAPR